MKKEPKTPHEEIMFCIESTNDIVSKILEILDENRKRRLAYENWVRGPKSDSL